MHLGIDFDNTIANYDTAFFAAARERNLVPEDVDSTKSGVKQFLIDDGRESDWTELQGFVYGPGIHHATPFPGFLEFVRKAAAAQWRLTIVSHKTKHPYRGPAYDLHAAAAGWLDVQGVMTSVNSRFFELTKEAKLDRVANEGIECFVDDLPDILRHERFPGSFTRPILFDPNGAHENTEFKRLSGWEFAWETLSAV